MADPRQIVLAAIYEKLHGDASGAGDVADEAVAKLRAAGLLAPTPEQVEQAGELRMRVTLRATAETPRALRWHDGKVYPWPESMPWPAPGTRGWLFGVPGILHVTPDGFEWHMTPADQVEAKRTAAVLVEVFPVGVPGRVRYRVLSLGPEPVERAVQINALRGAADVLTVAAAREQDDSGS